MHLDCYFSTTGINNELVIYTFDDLVAVSKCFMWMNWVVLQVMLKYVSGIVSDKLKNMELPCSCFFLFFFFFFPFFFCCCCNTLVNKLNSLERHVHSKQGKHLSRFRTVLSHS